MGLLRTIIILLLILLVIRYITSSFRKIFLSSALPKKNVGEAQKREEIVPCSTCGTYNPKQIALKVKEDYYCNEECLKGRK